MSAAMILAVAGLAAAGTFLVTSRSLSRVVLGFAMFGHAAVLALLASGGPAGDPPIVDGAVRDDTANPLPQALSLTAIVISFGLTLYVLALARRQQQLTGDDLVEDDVEDRRVAASAERHAERPDETQAIETHHEDGSGLQNQPADGRDSGKASR
ncbi:MAG TPA: NADH-quinone oxidoreductase subunit K [Ilumatobacteraceae bacterium]|jgi:multicomponent Na+:H+ antiporter subunit C|nr:NADH-quinone oxidoreductase subunit K [Ilumatobacteraceae bacterium]